MNVEPKVAPRPRFRVIGKFASAYMPRDYQDWQKEAANHLNAVLFGVEGVQFEGPVEVTLTFFCPKPKTTKLLTPKGDVDNYAKAALDAITKDGRFWHDDTQVAVLHATKVFAGPDTVPGIDVSIQGL